jgi:hypothetical protein
VIFGPQAFNASFNSARRPGFDRMMTRCDDPLFKLWSE